MGVGITGKYVGKKKVALVHLPSSATLTTDAPKDNEGEGALFSPTDLVAAALGSCMLTTMAIVGERSGLDLSGMHFEVEKQMISSPRRIGALPITIHLPMHLEPEQRQKMEHTAHACPVHRSLLPEVAVQTSFLYDV